MVESGALSFHFGLSPWVGLYLFSISCFYFSLAFISPCSCFYFCCPSLAPCVCVLFFLFGHVPSCSAWPVLRVGHAALCLLPVWSRGANLCHLGQRRCKCVDNVLSGVLHSRIPVPTSTASPRSRHRGTLCLPVIDLAPCGEDGMVASVEEAESSANSTSSDRPSAVLPIVSPPRGLLAWVS